jgi:hypothetical protein
MEEHGVSMRYARAVARSILLAKSMLGDSPDRPLTAPAILAWLVAQGWPQEIAATPSGMAEQDALAVRMEQALEAVMGDRPMTIAAGPHPAHPPRAGRDLDAPADPGFPGSVDAGGEGPPQSAVTVD